MYSGKGKNMATKPVLSMLNGASREPSPRGKNGTSSRGEKAAISASPESQNGKNTAIDLERIAEDNVDAGIANWQNFPASYISHHGKACCEIAREWITGMDFSQLNAGHPLTGPRWLRKLFKWGPSKWPIHWCEAVREKTLDCGALGALSHQLYLERGVRSFAAQFILEFNDVSTRHWSESWGAAGRDPHWINNGLIYHEGCAVETSRSRSDLQLHVPPQNMHNEIKLWDATATWWINPKQFGGYAGLLAVRIFDSAAEQTTLFTWGEHRIQPNIWHKVARARTNFATSKAAPKPRAKRRSAATQKIVEPAVVV